MSKGKVNYDNVFSGGFLKGLVSKPGSPEPAPSSQEDFQPEPLEGTVAAEQVSMAATAPTHADGPAGYIAGVIVPTEKREGFVVAIDLIRSYENNPRTAPYQNYEAIRESILVNGLEHRLIITKRPDQPFFIVAKGGNTRLRAMKDIVQNYAALSETMRERNADVAGAPMPRPVEDFLRLACDFVPYDSELALYEAHQRENLHHEQLTWWDEAKSAVAHKLMLERSLGNEISLRELARYRKSLGDTAVSTSPEFLSRAQFAVTCLWNFGERFPEQMQTRYVAQPARSYYNLVLSVLATRDASLPAKQMLADWTNAFTPDPDSNESGLVQLAHQWRDQALDLIGAPADHRDSVWTNVERLRDEQNVAGGDPFVSVEALLVFPEEHGEQAKGTPPPSETASNQGSSKPKASVADLRTKLEGLFKANSGTLNSETSALVRNVLKNETHPIAQLAQLARSDGSEAKLGKAFFQYIRALLDQADDE